MEGTENETSLSRCSDALPRSRGDTAFIIYLILLVAGVHISLFCIVNYIVPDPYMDEVFHVSQTIHYCQGRYRVWDKNITTFPGIYVAAATFLRGLLRLECSNRLLRAFNTFGGGFLYLILVWIALRRLHPGTAYLGTSGVQLLRFATHPVLCFYHFLYYTDTLATALVVAVLLDATRLEKPSFRSAVRTCLLCLVALLFRQTNVVFIGGAALYRLTTYIWQRSFLKHNPRISKAALSGTLVSISSGPNWNWFCYVLLPYAIPCGGFLIFVLLFNEGQLTLGHAEYHHFSFHWAQLVYLVIYLFLSSLPEAYHVWNVLAHCRESVSLRVVRTLLSTAVASAVFAYVCMQSGFIVHPFILADNRHWIFGLYRRCLRHLWARLGLLPVMFSLAITTLAVCWVVPLLGVRSEAQSHLVAMSRKNPVSRHVRKAVSLTPATLEPPLCALLGVFCVCSAAVLVPSPLLELRYFHVPLTLWLLHLPLGELAAPGSLVVPKERGSGRCGGPRQFSKLDQMRWLSVATQVVVTLCVMYRFLFCPFPYVNYAAGGITETGRMMY